MERGRRDARKRKKRGEGGGRKEKWRTSSQMRIGMDLGIDES